ncbi:MAG TPA: outer membrane protein assembly factor, partial [Sphingomicrobium sp.]|nr:outer membrane protein assembly factor [Sphingomicrobium sp.]
MRAWGRAPLTACAVAAILCPAALARAQTSGSAELDPTAPLDPMPDIGVEWPDMNAPDAVPLPDETTPPESVEINASKPVTIDAAEVHRYTVALEGVEGVDDEPALIKAFDAQSALREGKGEASNAAQIDRRSRADADLLTELLRSRGYFDAEVEPSIKPAQDVLQVVLT